MSPEAESPCPLCGGRGKITLKVLPDSHGEVYSLHTCTSCSITYIYPFPSGEALRDIYSGDYWDRPKAALAKSPLARLLCRFNETRLALTVRPLLGLLPPGSSVLDVGCGSGQLAGYLMKKKYEVEATDIDPGVLEEVRQRYGIKTYAGKLGEIDFPRHYDALVFNNVLEHLPDPEEALQVAAGLLEPGGLVFIEVPNIESLQFKVFRRSWFPLKVPEHLFHFFPRTLDMLAASAGLVLLRRSTFSPRISAAGYAASLFPVLRPERLRQSRSTLKMFAYLGLQTLFLPLALAEALAGRGAAVRSVYRKA